MIRSILKVAGLAVMALMLVAGVLYQFFGLRFVMDGGGTPYPRFVQTGDLKRSESSVIVRHSGRPPVRAASRGRAVTGRHACPDTGGDKRSRGAGRCHCAAAGRAGPRTGPTSGARSATVSMRRRRFLPSGQPRD